MKKFTVLAIGLLAATSALAGESGFIYQGQAHVVYKDGQKVGQTAAELGLVAQPPVGRKVATFSDYTHNNFGTIAYEDDGVARCYFGVDAGIGTNLFCVKR